MKLWCVLVTGLHHSCYECDGGGDADERTSFCADYSAWEKRATQAWAAYAKAHNAMLDELKKTYDSTPTDWPRWTLDGGATFMLAVRIVGPFEVEVDGQVTECPNGWLAMLPDGCPVAIPVDEFRRYGRWQPDAEEATA